ncbi:MAG: hypothetical protein R3B60_00730 [Candidatus Paceibacterota bacterium]
MPERYILPKREVVFIKSLKYHGFRVTRKRGNLKYTTGYIIPSTKREDHSGIDFWVKMPRDERLFPVQITQRGVSILKKYQGFTEDRFKILILESESRIRNKRKRCKQHGIAFVLVRDYRGSKTNPRIAWGDIKALRYAIAHLKRWL